MNKLTLLTLLLVGGLIGHARAEDPLPAAELARLVALLRAGLVDPGEAASEKAEPAPKIEPAPTTPTAPPAAAPAPKPAKAPIPAPTSLQTSTLTTSTLSTSSLQPSAGLNGRGSAGAAPRLSGEQWRLLFPLKTEAR